MGGLRLMSDGRLFRGREAWWCFVAFFCTWWAIVGTSARSPRGTCAAARSAVGRTPGTWKASASAKKGRRGCASTSSRTKEHHTTGINARSCMDFTGKDEHTSQIHEFLEPK